MEQLVVSILGSNKTGIANEICRLVSHCNCNLIDSRITVMGSEFTANLLLAGTWNALAKFEASLPAFEQKHQLRSLTRRTNPREQQLDILPYSIYITAISHQSVTAQVTQFFAEQNININDIYITNYMTPLSSIRMISVTLSVSVPLAIALADFRENLMLFCDEQNYDVILEPQKN